MSLNSREYFKITPHVKVFYISGDEYDVVHDEGTLLCFPRDLKY